MRDCCKCGCEFDDSDGIQTNGEFADDWAFPDVICYNCCTMFFIYPIFGASLEPMIFVNGVCQFQDGQSMTIEEWKEGKAWVAEQHDKKHDQDSPF